MTRLRALFVIGLGLLVGGSSLAIMGSVIPLEESAPEAIELGPFPVPELTPGPLTGLVVYLSAGHGYLLHRYHHDGAPFAWGQQRSRRYGMVEDEWTADYVADYLAPALEEAGATVLALRERDRNEVASISDDADASSAASEVAVQVRTELAHGGGYLRLEPNGGMVWLAEVPHDGHWYLYTRWVDDERHDDQAIYTVTAGGQTREVVVDQRHHGGHWWPLGNFCLFEGEVVEIALSGSGNGMLSADAVRLGGGQFVYAPEFDYKVRVHRMFDVAMPHQIDHLGAPPGLETYECGNPISDMRLRPTWASWAHPDHEEAVYLSIHTNASPRGRADGLTVFAGIDRNPVMPAYPGSVRLAEILEKQIWTTVRARDRKYRTRGARLGDFSEISPKYNELPGALLELGFHDDRREAKRLQSRRFQEDATAAIVNSLAEWRDTGRDGSVDAGD